MRLSRIYGVGGCVLFVCVHLVSSTVLTATMLTSFMGGFLMGKMTLGTFLMVMQGLNNGRTPIRTREGEAAESTLMDINDSEIENEIRDKFLKQLGEMDPLNCLPKVFCELSAPSKLTKITKVKLDEEADDTENTEEDDEASESEETNADGDGNDEDEEKFRIDQRRKKQNLKIESETLDALIQESSDPMDLYFILKDKMKLRPKYNHYTASHPPFWPQKGIMKKRGQANYQADVSEYKSAPTTMKASNKNIDDIFADDPFFDDFARSMKLFPENVDYRRVGRQLRRIEQESGDFRRKFRVAATVGEKSAKSCQHVFNTCPFEANQIMAMVNTLKRKNAGELISTSHQAAASTISTKKSNKTPSKEPVFLNNTMIAKNVNLQNLRNTLLAIESINNATRLAETAGMSVTYNQILDDVIESKGDSNSASSKIVDDFDKETEKMSTMSTTVVEDDEQTEVTVPRRKKSSKKQKTNSNKGSKTKNKNKGNKNDNNKYRITRNKSRQSTFTKRSARMSRSSRYSDLSSEESPEVSFEKSPLVVQLQVPVPLLKSPQNSTVAETNDTTAIFKTKTEEDDANTRRYLGREEFEDDEANASDDDNLYIPEFSKFQTYKRRPVVRPSPNPENIPVVTVNGRPVLAAAPSKPMPNNPTNSEAVLLPLPQFSAPAKTASMEKPPRQKFTHLVEDDELDASESDKVVEKIIATRHQIKPVKPKFRTKIIN